MLGPPAPVDGALGGHVLHHLEEQAELALGEHLLDTGDQLQEERVHAQVGRRTCHDQPHGGRPLAGQRPRGCTRSPAQLFGDAPDPVAGDLREPGRPLSANETALSETPARWAMSFMVGRRAGVRLAGEMSSADGLFGITRCLFPAFPVVPK